MGSFHFSAIAYNAAVNELGIWISGSRRLGQGQMLFDNFCSKLLLCSVWHPRAVTSGSL